MLLGERPSMRLIAAVPVVLAGVVLISGVVGADAYGEEPALGVVLGIGTAFAYSGFLLVLRAGNRDLRRPAGPLLDATIAAGLGSAVAGAALGELDLVLSWAEHGWLLLLAVSAQVIGWLLITASLPRLPAAISSVLLTAQPAATVLLAMLLVDEDPSIVQLTGVVVVIAGLATVAGRRRPAERGLST